MRRAAVIRLVLAAAVGGMVALGSGCGSLWIWREVEVAEPAPIEVAMGDQDVPHVSVFYDALAEYGTWSLDEDHGWVWEPADAAFVPYTRGSWVETEVGPTWLGDEPYGWAVDHYGRWEWVGTSGQGRWRWIPMTGWGPAWVEWRTGEGVVGWAPLGPDEGARGVGAAPAEAWQFVANSDLFAHDVGTRVYGQAYAGYFLIRSRPHVRWAERHATPALEARAARAARFPTGPVPAMRGTFGARTRLSGLPAERIRWLPAWARKAPSRLVPGLPARGSIRAAPARPQRFDRAGPAHFWPRPPHGGHGTR